MKKADIEARAESVAGHLGDHFLEAGRQLRLILDETPELFGDVVTMIGIGRRRAYALAQIDRQFSHLGIDRERLRQIGWTKLLLIGQYINADGCEELLSLAETNTVNDLRMMLALDFKAVPVHGVVLLFRPDEYAIFEAAILAHGAKKKTRGIGGKEAALIKALTTGA